MELWINVLVAIIAGGTASVISPLVKWGVEKRRQRMGYRKELIQKWRTEVAALYWTGNQGFFANTSTYAEIRPYLKPREISIFEGRTVAVPAEGRELNPERNAILDAIARIAKDWGLA